MKEFVKKYKEVKVQAQRQKTITTQLSTTHNNGEKHNAMFMGTKSLSRRRSQEASF